MVIFSVDLPEWTAAEFVAELESCGVRALTTSTRHVRLVTHFDVSDDEVDRASQDPRGGRARRCCPTQGRHGVTLSR